MSKVSKRRHNFNYRRISMEIEIEIVLFESTKFVLVVFGFVLSADLMKVD